MYKIAHLADTHIKNLKFHYEYKIVFEQLYETLRKENVDYIVHCGDIAHTKTQISPEFVELCSDFFSNLAKIAPTYIILANNDVNLKKTSLRLVRDGGAADAADSVLQFLGSLRLLEPQGSGRHLC